MVATIITTTIIIIITINISVMECMSYYLKIFWLILMRIIVSKTASITHYYLYPPPVTVLWDLEVLVKYMLNIWKWTGLLLTTLQNGAKVGLQLWVCKTIYSYIIINCIIFHTNNYKPTFTPFCIYIGHTLFGGYFKE